MITLDQIKERKVFRWALAYGAASWALLQLAQFLWSLYNWPSALLRMMPIALAFGFMAVVVVAWFHGEKGQQRVTALEAALLVGLLVFAGAALKLMRKTVLTTGDAATAGSPVFDPRSVAVLPLENMSPDPNDAFFADGIHDEILTHLSRIADLDVRSRTSVLDYRHTVKKIPEIARELGVRYIMEGSVRRARNQARITVQLIDATTDKHVWAETYDGSLSDVFGMQTTVARKIAATLEAELSPTAESQLASKPTANTDAYDLYLRAREYGRRSYSRDDFGDAVDLAREAIALDPNFAEAHAELSRSLSSLFWFHYNRSDSLKVQARLEAERAIELKPTIADGHRSLAYYYYRVNLDYEKALKEAAVAQQLAPNDADIALLQGSVYRRKGDINSAIRELGRSFSLNPRDPLTAMNLGLAYRLARRYDDAIRVLEGALRIGPDQPDIPLSIAQIHLYHTGDVAAARSMLALISRGGKTFRAGEATYPLYAARVEMFDRKPDAAIAILHQTPDSLFYNQYVYSPKSLLLAQAYAQKHDPRLYAARAYALVGLGRNREAIASAQHATRLLPLERELWRGGILAQDLARVYAATGEADRAIELLAKLLKVPGDIGVGALRLDPAWDALRQHPKFQRLIR